MGLVENLLARQESDQDHNDFETRLLTADKSMRNERREMKDIGIGTRGQQGVDQMRRGVGIRGSEQEEDTRQDVGGEEMEGQIAHLPDFRACHVKDVLNHCSAHAPDDGLLEIHHVFHVGEHHLQKPGRQMVGEQPERLDASLFDGDVLDEWRQADFQPLDRWHQKDELFDHLEFCQ